MSYNGMSTSVGRKGAEWNFYEYVGQRIRELRSEHGGPPGISQEVLAQKLEVATNTISRWETATYHPTLADLERLARFFGVSILELLPGAAARRIEAVGGDIGPASGRAGSEGRRPR